jgi:hypothetical protein
MRGRARIGEKMSVCAPIQRVLSVPAKTITIYLGLSFLEMENIMPEVVCSTLR